MAATDYVRQAHGGLALSPLPPRGGPEGVVRAAAWHNLLHRIGHHLPLVLVHDLGRLLVEGPRALAHPDEVLAAAGLAPGRPLADLLGLYRQLLGELAGSELVARARTLALSDEMIAAVVGRVYEPVLEAMGSADIRVWLTQDLPLEASAYDVADPAALFADHGGAYEEIALRWAAERSARVVTSAERIDVDALRLMALFAGDASIAGAEGALELYRVLDDPAAAGVVHFSLELLPQLFEHRRSRGLQRFAVDGLAGVARRGSLDQIVPGELAWPDDLFARKYAENELLYYGREAERETERRVHMVLVDASASMRGARAVFARSLALGLVKKLVTLGEEVQVRFFDARLHAPLRVTAQNHHLPYLLCWRSERGRNYGRAFKGLLDELTRLRRRDQRQAAVYFITHGECHVPAATVEALAALAFLYGVYVLPQHGLNLDYLPLLHRHRVVSREDLGEGRRRAAALEIVEEVSQARGRRPGARA